MSQDDRYIWNPDDYAKHSSVQQKWAREVISKLQLDGDEAVLDIGCGDGKITAEIASHLSRGNVLGVDSSSEMIEFALNNFPQVRYPNLSFQVVDARRLPFKEQFDLVFSNAALHWIKDHKHLVLGIKSSLKPNGRMLLQMGGKGNAESMIAILETVIAEKEWEEYFSGFEFPYGFYSPVMYNRWLKEASLNPIRLELIPKDMSYSNEDGFAGWIRTSWLPYTNRVPVHLREKFIAQIVERYMKIYPSDSEGYIHVSMIRLEVEAINNA
jgi:trans-aconitate methyltransferase